MSPYVIKAGGTQSGMTSSIIMSATLTTTSEPCPLQGETGLLLLRDHDLHELSHMGYCLDDNSENSNSVTNVEGTIHVSHSRDNRGAFIQNIRIEFPNGRTFSNNVPYRYYTSKCLLLLRRTMD